MLKNLITDLKLTAMDVVEEVKDIAHDLKTDLPDAVQKDFKVFDNPNIASTELNYMNSWNAPASRITANQIDMIMDKVNFISEMIQTGLLGFDAIEQELRLLAGQPNPPQPAQLISIATRIDATQRQTFASLQTLRELTREVDRATDKLQGGGGNDWNIPPQRNGW